MTTSGTSALRFPIFFLLLLASAFSIFLVRFSVAGLPVRVLLVFMIGAIITALYPRYVLGSVVTMRWPLLVLAYAGLCAMLSSYFAKNNMGQAFGQLFEIHIQAAVNLVICNALVYMLGVRNFSIALLFPIVFSGFIALMQFASIPGGWALYHVFAGMQPQSYEDLEFFSVEYRPLGLSYSPVHLGTQICHVFAVVFCLIQLKFATRESVMSSVYLAALVIFVAVISTVSGNRSPTLGLVVFLAVYIIIESARYRFVFLGAGLVLFVVGDAVIQILAATGLRVFNTTNSSGAGREVLRAYGWLLFLDNPLGYGILFNSQKPEMWSKYLFKLLKYEHPENITIHALHNSYLVMLNKHGAQLLLLAPLIARWFFSNKIIFYAYLPYIIHCYYHNDGPLQGDFIFWYVLPLVIATAQLATSRKAAARSMAVPYPPLGYRQATPLSA